MAAKSAAPKAFVFNLDEAAVLKGGASAGEYLDKLGKSDLMTLTKAEWTTFCTRLIGRAMLAAMGDVYGDEIPF